MLILNVGKRKTTCLQNQLWAPLVAIRLRYSDGLRRYGGGGLLWDDWILGSPNYYKQHLFVYPTSNGVGYVQYEGYREAINDIRYMTKLITVCQLVKDEGKNVSAIEAYMANLKDWNSTIMKNIDSK